MGDIRRWLSLVFALVLLLQAGVGVAHCLRGFAPANGLWVEICTLDGQRLALLDAEGRPLDGDGTIGQAVCPVCAGLPMVLLPAAPTVSEPVRFATPAAFSLTGSPVPAPRARAPPYGSRAPPALA